MPAIADPPALWAGFTRAARVRAVACAHPQPQRSKRTDAAFCRIAFVLFQA